MGGIGTVRHSWDAICVLHFPLRGDASGLIRGNGRVSDNHVHRASTVVVIPPVIASLTDPKLYLAAYLLILTYAKTSDADREMKIVRQYSSLSS